MELKSNDYWNMPHDLSKTWLGNRVNAAGTSEESNHGSSLCISKFIMCFFSKFELPHKSVRVCNKTKLKHTYYKLSDASSQLTQGKTKTLFHVNNVFWKKWEENSFRVTASLNKHMKYVCLYRYANTYLHFSSVLQCKVTSSGVTGMQLLVSKWSVMLIPWISLNHFIKVSLPLDKYPFVAIKVNVYFKQASKKKSMKGHVNVDYFHYNHTFYFESTFMFLEYLIFICHFFNYKMN